MTQDQALWTRLARDLDRLIEPGDDSDVIVAELMREYEIKLREPDE